MNIIIAYFENLGNAVGGLERVICDFSNEFTRRGHHVTVVTFDETQDPPYYPIDQAVSIINLQKEKRLHISGPEKFEREIYRLGGRAAARQWKFSWKRRHGVSDFAGVVKEINPDVIVSFETMTSREIIEEGIKIPLITSLQNDSEICCQGLPHGEIRAIKESTAVHVLLKSFAEFLKSWINEEKIRSIPNVIPQFELPVQLEDHKNKFKIINVARLNKKQKRQEILIKAFALIAEKYPDWSVEIWGKDTSNYKQELETLIHKHHLEERVFLKGTTHEINQVYQQADILGFPSAFEGFSLALGEAMSAGLPVVGFKSCNSVRGIVEDGVTGVLSADGTEAFAMALEELMKDREKRIRMGQVAHEAMKAYNSQSVWNQWEKLLNNTIEKNHGINKSQV